MELHTLFSTNCNLFKFRSVVVILVESDHDYNVAMRDQSLSNVNLDGKKFISFHKYVKYINKCDMIICCR